MMALLPELATYWWCAADIPRAMAPNLVASVRPELNGEVLDSPLEALRGALASGASEDVIWVGGSLFVVGDVLRDAPGSIEGWPHMA